MLLNYTTIERIVIWFANNITRDSERRAELRKKLHDLETSTEHRVIKEVKEKIEGSGMVCENIKDKGHENGYCFECGYNFALKDLQDWLNSKEV